MMSSVSRVAGLALFIWAMGLFAGAQTIENDRFRVTLKDGGALEVVDKPASLTWVQPAGDVQVSQAQASGAELVYRLNDQFNVTISLGENAIDCTVSGDPDASIQGLEYPAGFRLAEPQGDPRLLLTNCAGMAIPYSMKDEPLLERAKGVYASYADQNGLMMPWLGEDNGEAASMILVLTPFDANMRVDADDRGYNTRAVWLDSKGRLAYDRRARFLFVNSGGAVALCKLYRDYAEEQGLLVTLKEKSESLPQMDRFLGAMSLWNVDWPEIDLYKEMKEAGIEKVLVNYHASQKIPEGTVNRPGYNTVYEPMDRAFVEQLHGLGFLAGRYDYYRTIFPPTDNAVGGNQWIFRRVGYPEQIAVNKDGGLVGGFRATGGGEAIRGHRCSKCQFEMALVYIPLDVDRTPYDARLLDAVAAVNWQECYSPAHPVTREEDCQWRLKQLGVAFDYGQLVGTEHMASWAVPTSVYAEAPTTFVRFAGYRESFNAQPFETPEGFRAVVLNERLRFPLWQLVFHDAVVITNRWTFAANKYADPTIWDQENLINLLHGQMPTFMIDRENFEANKERFIKTAETVCKWNGEIGYEEMTDFRWLSDDAKVQQVTYGSGKSVVVNFGESEFTMADGTKVPARGYVTR